jgi:hypothetical protein
MTLGEICKTLNATSVTDNPPLDREIQIGCASDLMSDVLAFSQSNAILLTGLVAPQSVRTAEIADILAVCYVFKKQPPPETIELAEENGIPLFVSPLTLFVASGKLYEAGLPGCQSQ